MINHNSWTVAIMLVAGAAAPLTAQPIHTNRRAEAAGIISFHLVGDGTMAGFDNHTVANGGNLFVKHEPAFYLEDVSNTAASNTREGIVTRFDLKPGVAETLALGVSRSGASALAVMRDGRVMAVAAIETIAVDAVTLSGLSRGTVSRLFRPVTEKDAAPSTATVLVIPRRDTITAGDSVTVDLYVSHVPDLKTYQFLLKVTGGVSGELTREHGAVEQSRSDFVFGGNQSLHAVDEVHGRLGAVLFQGATEVTAQKYVGSYTYQASLDASGSFLVSVSPSQTSFLVSGAGEEIPFRISAATVVVR